MAVDMFLKLDGIKGESSDEKHKEEIDVLSWSWGLSQSGSMHSSSGGGSGKVSVQDLSFTKHIDKATPNLLKLCCNGHHIKEAQLTVRKAGGKQPVEYLKIKLKEVLVSAVTTGGSGGDDRITENVTLNFGEFEVEYTPQGKDGAALASIPVAWNIRKNC